MSNLVHRVDISRTMWPIHVVQGISLTYIGCVSNQADVPGVRLHCDNGCTNKNA